MPGTKPGSKKGKGGQQVQLVAAGPAKLDKEERRKLVKEIREELKPLCSQIADFQIEKSNQVIKTQIRKLENEMTVADQKLSGKIDREIKST